MGLDGLTEVVIQLTWILETELGSLEKQYALLTTEISIYSPKSSL